MVSLLAPIQAAFQSSKEWQEVEKLAYPPPVVIKKVKKAKDKGSKHPGTGKVLETQPDGSVEGTKKDEVSLGKEVDTAMEKLNVDAK